MKLNNLFLLLFIAGCALTKKPKDTDDDSLINLVDSTRLIQTVIAQGKLGDLLEECDPEKLDLLLNNTSPARMAFEAEVLATTVPLVVVYYFTESPEAQEYIKQLQVVAKEYDNRIKFVTIDTEKLYSLAKDAEIEETPVFIFTKNREIVTRIDGPVSIDELRRLCTGYV